MRILRVFLVGAPDASRSDAWALFDASGRAIEHGHGIPEQWPAADRREAVLAADAVRVVALALPPLPPSRVASAAIYSLEDRIATPAEQVAIGVGEQDAGGRVIAVAAARELAQALVDSGFARAIAEPQLAPARAGWRWCESESSAFVRTADGGAFSVSRAIGASLPAELSHALLQAARDGAAPGEVIVERASSADTLDQWSRATGVPFVAGSPWRWHEADPGLFREAIDVLAALRMRIPAERTQASLTFAFVLLGCAIAVHVIATLVTFARTEYRVANLSRDLVPIALDLGAAGATPRTAAADIARVHAERRHRAGLPAANDAMQVLARAAPALAALPQGALRTATFSAGAWTLELAPLDDPTLGALVERLASAGLASLHARTASGVRARIMPS